MNSMKVCILMNLCLLHPEICNHAFFVIIFIVVVVVINRTVAMLQIDTIIEKN